MSVLAIYSDAKGGSADIIRDHNEISAALNKIGVQFDRWEAGSKLSNESTQVEILNAYENQVNRLKEKYNFQSADVVSLHAQHPDKDTLRKKFLSEHTHTDFEVRFFVEGSGLFYLHVGQKVYAILCTRGDLLSVPANVPHWFDMGATPEFKCIRLFTDPSGWIGHFTGSDISESFPQYEEFVESFA